jgi:hypothetical protein
LIVTFNLVLTQNGRIKIFCRKNPPLAKPILFGWYLAGLNAVFFLEEENGKAEEINKKEPLSARLLANNFTLLHLSLSRLACH